MRKEQDDPRWDRLRFESGTDSGRGLLTPVLGNCAFLPHELHEIIDDPSQPFFALLYGSIVKSYSFDCSQNDIALSWTPDGIKRKALPVLLEVEGEHVSEDYWVDMANGQDRQLRRTTVVIIKDEVEGRHALTISRVDEGLGRMRIGIDGLDEIEKGRVKLF